MLQISDNVGLMIRHDWHVALHAAGDGIAGHADLARSLRLHIVIDNNAWGALHETNRRP